MVVTDIIVADFYYLNSTEYVTYQDQQIPQQALHYSLSINYYIKNPIYHSAIQWDPSGKAIEIIDRKRLEENIIP